MERRWTGAENPGQNCCGPVAIATQTDSSRGSCWRQSKLARFRTRRGRHWADGARECYSRPMLQRQSIRYPNPNSQWSWRCAKTSRPMDPNRDLQSLATRRRTRTAPSSERCSYQSKKKKKKRTLLMNHMLRWAAEARRPGHENHVRETSSGRSQASPGGAGERPGKKKTTRPSDWVAPAARPGSLCALGAPLTDVDDIHSKRAGRNLKHQLKNKTNTNVYHL